MYENSEIQIHPESNGRLYSDTCACQPNIVSLQNFWIYYRNSMKSSWTEPLWRIKQQQFQTGNYAQSHLFHELKNTELIWW